MYTLKFYLKLGLIQEAGRSPGTHYRFFDEETVTRLAKIRTLRKAGKGLKEIETLLTLGSDPPSRSLHG